MVAQRKHWSELIERAAALGMEKKDIEDFIGMKVTEAGPNEFDRVRVRLEQLEKAATEAKEATMQPTETLEPEPKETETVTAPMTANIDGQAVPLIMQTDPVLLDLMRQQKVQPPTVKDVYNGKVFINPGAIPPECKKLEDAKLCRFAWLPAPVTDADKQQLAQLHWNHGGVGYYRWVTRREFSGRISDKRFGAHGGIQRGDTLLAYVPWDIWEAMCKRRWETSAQRLNDSRRGYDDEGKIGGDNVVVSGGQVDDNTEFTVPNVTGLTDSRGRHTPPMFHGDNA